MNFVFLRKSGWHLWLALLVSVFNSGCAYHGSLKSGFHKPSTHGEKLPLKVNLICGPSMGGTFNAENVYFAHSVHVSTDPALALAFKDSCQSLFETVVVTSSLGFNINEHPDFILIPSGELIGQTFYLRLTVKDPISGEVIQRYQAAGNIKASIPVGVHFLGAINILVCGLASPIICPAVTQLLGARAKNDLAACLSSSFSRLEQDLANDQIFLKNKASRPR